MTTFTRTAEPASEPITTAEAKTQMRVDIDDDDTYIGQLIQAAREVVEDMTRRSFFTQTWRLSLDNWSGGIEIELPRAAPLQSVTSIVYTDSDDNSTTLSSSAYAVDTDSEPGRVVLKHGESWPTGTLRTLNPIQVTYVTGYSDVDDIPKRFKQLIKLIVSHWYENREPVIVGSIVGELPMGAKSLIWLNRVY